MKLYYASNQETFFKTEGNIILFWILHSHKCNLQPVHSAWDQEPQK
jgi:hypothetical protein